MSRHTSKSGPDLSTLNIMMHVYTRLRPLSSQVQKEVEEGVKPSSCPDFVLVTPIAAKTQKQQTNVKGWILRSGRGRLRELESTSAAPPATNRATNPRQHRPKDLSKHWRDIIHVVKIKYCEGTRPQNQLNAAKAQHK